MIDFHLEKTIVPMPFTEQEVQMLASFNGIICEMYKQWCKKRIEEEDRRHDEEIKAQLTTLTEEELHKALSELASYNPYRDLKMHPREHILRAPQPFYTKFLNKRNKRKKTEIIEYYGKRNITSRYDDL